MEEQNEDIDLLDSKLSSSRREREILCKFFRRVSTKPLVPYTVKTDKAENDVFRVDTGLTGIRNEFSERSSFSKTSYPAYRVPSTKIPTHPSSQQKYTASDDLRITFYFFLSTS